MCGKVSLCGEVLDWSQEKHFVIEVLDWNSFVREISFLAELDHPHIIKLIEFFDEQDCMYLVLDLCEGPDLIDKINDVCSDHGY